MKKIFLLGLVFLFLISGVSAYTEYKEYVNITSATSSTSTAELGYVFYQNETSQLLYINKQVGSGVTKAYIYIGNGTSGTLLGSGSFSGNRANVTSSNIILYEGQYYTVVADNNGSAFNIKYSSSGQTFPRVRNTLSWSGRWNGVSIDTAGIDTIDYIGVNSEPSLTDKFTVRAKNNVTGTYLSNINVTLENGTVYTNTSDIVITPFNDNRTLNFTVSVANYYNQTFTNYNTSVNLIANLTKIPGLSIYAQDYFTNTTIDTFNVTVTNTALSLNETYTTTTSNINTTLDIGYSYNVTIYAEGYAIVTTQIPLVNDTTYTFRLFTTNSIYMLFYDVSDLTLINDTNITVDLISDDFGTQTSTSNGTLYVDLLTPSTYTIRFNADGYAEGSYVTTVQNRSNQTLSLYLQNSSTSSNVTITIIDQTANTLENANIKVLKYVPSTGNYNQVASGLTNFAGQKIFPLELGTEFYKFIVEYPVGTVVLTTNPTYVYSTSLTLQAQLVGQIAQGFFRLNDITYEHTFNTATDNFRFTYSDANNVVSEACVEVYRRLSTGNEFFDSSCNTGASGTILVSVDAINGSTYLSKAYVTYGDGETIFISELEYRYNESTLDTNTALLIVILLTATFALMGAWSPSVAAIITPLPILITSMIGIIALNPTIGIALELLGVIIAYLVRR